MASFFLYFFFFIILPITVVISRTHNNNNNNSKMDTIAELQIRQCFKQWTDAWNDGDLEGYSDSYLDSRHTRYVSGKHIIHGKDKIVETLKIGGSPKGDLSLVKLDIDVMSNLKDAICFGQYKLSMDNDEEIHEGCFTVHVRLCDGLKNNIDSSSPNPWKIISDHSS